MLKSQELIDEIVSKILKEININDSEDENKKTVSKCNGVCKGNCKCKKEKYIFNNVDEAIEAAEKAYYELKKLSLSKREKIVTNIRKKCLDYAEVLATMAVEETGMGRVDHKIIKHELIAKRVPGTEDLKTIAWSGDGGLTLIEQGPFGIIASITPSTNPTATVLCNSIGMISAGNTVVFAPHPNAIICSNKAVKLINEASVEAGGPENIVVSLKNISIETTKELMNHKKISLISATGGPSVVTEALTSGKRALGAGAGNPPVIVDDTADILQAAKDILDGATFDNNLPCIAEKEVIVLESVADKLIKNMIMEGAYFLKDTQLINKLEALIAPLKNNKRVLNRSFVGKDAMKILDAIGVTTREEIRCIIFEADKEHSLVKEELMMPILGIVRVKDFEEAVKVAVELEGGNKHSAHIHSKNIDNLTTFAKEIDTAIFVKNAPSYSALGINAEGYATFTIASRTGEGLTSAKTFTKNRRCVLSQALSIR